MNFGLNRFTLSPADGQEQRRRSYEEQFEADLEDIDYESFRADLDLQGDPLEFDDVR
jgi:hypothetical protein